MHNPKVTVITITYNLIDAGRKNFIRQTIESVIQQTYKNIEHLIIDGASTDGTLDILTEYKNKGVLTLCSEKDNGIYDAMNKGIAKARGEYILFLNSDDYFHDNEAVEKSVKYIQENNASFSYAACRYLSKNNEFLGTLKPLIGSFIVCMPFSHQTMLVKKECFVKLNSFNTEFNSAGDFDFILRLCLSGAKGVEVPFDIVTYRLGGLSDFNQEQSIAECSKSIQKNYEKFMKLPIETCQAMFLEHIIPKDLFNHIVSYVSEDYKTILTHFFAHYTADIGDVYKITKHPELEGGEKEKTYKYKYFLFGFILLMKIIKCGAKTRFYLFGILPVWKIVKRHYAKKNYLFGLLPILAIKEN